MGDWSHEPFGNDVACDWAPQLFKQPGLSPLDRALDDALNAPAPLDHTTATEAIAAIEVLAKLLQRGTQSDACTREIDIWVAAQRQPPRPPSWKRRCA